MLFSYYSSSRKKLLLYELPAGVQNPDICSTPWEAPKASFQIFSQEAPKWGVPESPFQATPNPCVRRMSKSLSKRSYDDTPA